jgi:hypothetical protein
MVMVLGPTRKKADVMAEQRAVRETRKRDSDAEYAAAQDAEAEAGAASESSDVSE